MQYPVSHAPPFVQGHPEAPTGQSTGGAAVGAEGAWVGGRLSKDSHTGTAPVARGGEKVVLEMLRAKAVGW